MGSIRPFGVALASTVAIVAAGLGTTVLASHSWGNYHWARTTSSFPLTIVNSTTGDWDPFVTAATQDWSKSTRLDMVQSAGLEDSTVRRKCSAPTGQVRICNLEYGQNGWLGIAGISIDAQGHIIKGYTKLNDTYFQMAYYDSNLWKQSVACQELGHNIGLDHQDEDFDNKSLNTCMDYQDPPTATPNAHDFDQLASIYGHTDSYDSYGSGTAGGGCKGRNCAAAPQAEDNDDRRAWGLSLGRKGQKETFLRIDPDGIRHLTFVTWAQQ